MYKSHLKSFKEKIASLCLVIILAMIVLPGCKNPPASAGEKSLPDMPMTDPPENSLAWVVSQKPAIESKLLSDMESLENWEPWLDPLGYGTISLSNDRFYKGKASVLLTSPTKGERKSASNSDIQVFDALIPGRPWGSSSAIYRADNEDWSEWNRITLWVYPDLPGFRTVSFNIVLHNDTREDTTVTLEKWDDAFVP